MKPLTDRLPKVMIPVNARPFTDYQLEWLAGQGVGRVVYAIGRLGGAVREYVGDGSRWGLDVSFSDEGDAPLGTAGAVRLAVDGGMMDGAFLVLYGDSFLTIGISPVWEAAMAGEIPLMCVFRNQDGHEKSNVNFENGLVMLYEKSGGKVSDQGMRYIDYGLSVLSRDVVEEMTESGEASGLAGLYRRLSLEGKLHGYEVFDRYYEIGSPRGLKELESYLRANPAMDGNGHD